MSYTGKVTVGGPADTRELPGLTITKVSVGPMDNNAYLLRCTQTGELALIDAANDADTLLGLIGDTPLATIITTHQHWDHHAALPQVQQATGAATVAHPKDAPGLPIPVTRPVQHGDTIAVGNAELSVIHLRGHTPGSIALCYDGNGSARRPAAPVYRRLAVPRRPGQYREETLQRFSSLMTDLEERVFAQLPDGDLGVPGPRRGYDPRHGAPAPARVARPRLVGAPAGWRYSSPENRSQADWRVMPSASPIRAHVTPRERALPTHPARFRSTCAPAAVTRGRSASTSSALAGCSQGGSCGTEAGLPAITSAHNSTHSEQIKTPGPATSVLTSVFGLRQNEHAAITDCCSDIGPSPVCQA